MKTDPIERGTYARFALATPNDGDQTVEVFRVIEQAIDHGDADLAPGFYWQQLPEIEPQHKFDSEMVALDAARAHYGY